MLINSKWITYKTGPRRDKDEKYGNPSPYFRRNFSTRGGVKSAILSISSLGVYKAYINGEAVAEDFLSPGWVDYRKKLPLVRYDITDKIKESNAIGVVLGDGWAVGHLGSTYAFLRCGYCEWMEFTAQIDIEYLDGTREQIITDDTWRASKGSILRSDIYMGEYVDGRLDLGNFSSPDYDDSTWGYAEVPLFKFSRNLLLEEKTTPPIVTKHIFKPTRVKKEGDAYLFDVGQNIAGVISLSLKGKTGAAVTLRHGELLTEGRLYTENLRKAEATDTYILSGKGVEHFRPLFTYHGFRFVEITVEGEAEILDITAEAMYTDLPTSGEFSCSDKIVNRIYENALWGQRDNFYAVPTDCPQRDERLGWTADAQIFARSAMWNMDCEEYFKKYLADIRDAQLGNGVIPAVAPVPPVGSYSYTGRDAASGWCEAIGEIPYDHFVMYGDKRILGENLPALKRLLGYYGKESPDGVRSGKGAYGDWLSLGEPSDISAISTLYYVRAAYLAKWMCELLGDYETDYYSALYERVKAAFCQRFIDNDGRIANDTQSLYVMAYRFGIIDKDEVKKHLLRKLEEDGGKLTCGFLGIKHLLPTLSDIGCSEIAYALITSTDFPGWGYSIVNGATTIWEHWDSYTEEGGIRPGMNSFNHYSFGSCTEWMYEYCLGIQPSKDGGFRKITLAPSLDRSGRVNYAEGYYDSPYGRIEISWQRNGDSFRYSATIPEEIAFSLSLDGFDITEESHKEGKHIWVIK
ncbi:MAG: family 78 glycoside hydrolase catalytic domain [Clostridia bacterium]|nr:family 78 glycoside hydrolase catalytic domain [Clostridia bacterium]